MTVMTKWRYVVTIRANTGATDGDIFLEEAIRELSVWGGMSSSDGIVNDEGEVSISFDPDTADGGPAAVLRWLDSMEIEYHAEFFRWWKD